MLNKFKLNTIATFIVIFMFGFGPLIGGIITYFIAKDFKDNGETTYAIIRDIHTSTTIDDEGNRKTSHSVRVEYTATNGRHYSGFLNKYNSNMRIGDSVLITYLKHSPGKLMYGTPKVPPASFYILFGVSLIGPIILITFIVIDRHQKIKYFKKIS